MPLPKGIQIPASLRDCLVAIGSAAMIAVSARVWTTYELTAMNAIAVASNRERIEENEAATKEFLKVQGLVVNRLTTIETQLKFLEGGQKDLQRLIMRTREK